MHVSSLNIVAYLITNDGSKKINNCKKERGKGMSVFKFTNDNNYRSNKYRHTNPPIKCKIYGNLK